MKSVEDVDDEEDVTKVKRGRRWWQRRRRQWRVHSTMVYVWHVSPSLNGLDDEPTTTCHDESCYVAKEWWAAASQRLPIVTNASRRLEAIEKGNKRRRTTSIRRIVSSQRRMIDKQKAAFSLLDDTIRLLLLLFSDASRTCVSLCPAFSSNHCHHHCYHQIDSLQCFDFFEADRVELRMQCSTHGIARFLPRRQIDVTWRNTWESARRPQSHRKRLPPNWLLPVVWYFWMRLRWQLVKSEQHRQTENGSDSDGKRQKQYAAE